MNKALALAIDNKIKALDRERKMMLEERNKYIRAWCLDEGYFAGMNYERAIEAMRRD